MKVELKMFLLFRWEWNLLLRDSLLLIHISHSHRLFVHSRAVPPRRSPKSEQARFWFHIKLKILTPFVRMLRFSHDLFSLVHSVHEQMKSGRAGAWHSNCTMCLVQNVRKYDVNFFSFFFVVYVRWYEIWGSENSPLSCAAARERRRKIDLKCFWDNLTQ